MEGSPISERQFESSLLHSLHCLVTDSWKTPFPPALLLFCSPFECQGLFIIPMARANHCLATGSTSSIVLGPFLLFLLCVVVEVLPVSFSLLSLYLSIYIYLNVHLYNSLFPSLRLSIFCFYACTYFYLSFTIYPYLCSSLSRHLPCSCIIVLLMVSKQVIVHLKNHSSRSNQISLLFLLPVPSPQELLLILQITWCLKLILMVAHPWYAL